MLRFFSSQFLILLFICSSINAQNINALSKQLIVLEQNIVNKAFVKAWKKKKKDWEEKCKKSKTAKELIDLFNKLSTCYSTHCDAAHFNIPDIKYVSFCNALISYLGQTEKKDFGFSDDELNSWKSTIYSLAEGEKKRLIEIEKAKSEEIINNLMIDFEDNYLLVLEASKKGSFENVISDKISEKEYHINVNFNNAAEQRILVDNDNTFQFVLVFDSDSSKELALNIKKYLSGVIEKTLPEKFKKTSMYDASYLKNNRFIYEYQGVKFAETAKRPTISVGLKKENFQIVLIITEPVFKM